MFSFAGINKDGVYFVLNYGLECTNVHSCIHSAKVFLFISPEPIFKSITVATVVRYLTYDVSVQKKG